MRIVTKYRPGDMVTWRKQALFVHQIGIDVTGDLEVEIEYLLTYQDGTDVIPGGLWVTVKDLKG